MSARVPADALSGPLRWQVAPLPLDEPERLQALRRYEVLDTPAEPAFDDLAFLAAEICETPVALISLVDEGRQWFKARVGLDAQETPREMAFCSHALLQPAEVFEVGDATLDDRFADNPLVLGEPRVRFYAGAVLVTPDQRMLGTLCVIDCVPRALDARQRASLQALSRQVVAQLELRRAARTDVLTRLPNRSALHAALQRAAERAAQPGGRPFGVLFVDFDRFKRVNDDCGHDVGDALLKQIAERLQPVLAAVATAPGDAAGEAPHADRSAIEAAAAGPLVPTLGRMGGDEFVVLLEQLPAPAEAAASAVAERLRDALAQPFKVCGHVIRSSASIGIAVSGGQGGDAGGVLRDADLAMYEAKRGGRDRCVLFDTAMHELALRRVGLEADLREALATNGLAVAYQPIVDLADGRCVGVEALARWRHAERGDVQPLEFIPVAEESGLIGALGRWVLDAACAQFTRWQRSLGSRAPRSLSVNLSRGQIVKPGFVAQVDDLLRRHGVAAACLQLELTESLAAQDETVIATLHGLRELGVRLALDDFGTGYSSLSCLGELPVDTVKIDRSFVSRAETSMSHRALIAATLSVADSLGLTSVAEGVETEGQATLLRDLGCRLGQGYLFSRPLGADDCTRWLGAADAIDAPGTVGTVDTGAAIRG